MIMKVLAPAGNFECLKSAIYGGADEVYLGINHFNARNNIDGFTMSSLKEAVDFAHIYGVKVCLAINILFTNDEINLALSNIVDAYNIGVDAFIIQDIGLAKILHENYPEIEKHASTQMGIHNLEGVKYIESLGFSRVVLARETPLDEVRRIKENSNIEIEYFVHGALCVSFSGNCYLSSYTQNASGNRGRCKQLCRLPYTLKKGGVAVKNGYLLSAKDFNMLSRLDDLKNAGVDVLKIEGRARRPYYVYTATLAYKNALLGKSVDKNSLMLAFNRTFTEGYFNGNSNIISKLQNHIGIEVGRVQKVNNGKKFNEVFFSSNVKISPKSTLKFLHTNEQTVLSAYDLTLIENNLYRVTTTAKIEVGATVNLIADYEREKNIASLKSKREIDLKLYLLENKPIKAEIFLNGQKIEVVGNSLQKAKSQPLTKRDIIDCFNKSEYFSFNAHFEGFDDVFLVKSQLNEFRRKVAEEIKKVILKSKRRILLLTDVKSPKKAQEFSDFCYIEDLDDLCQIKEKNIVYSPETYEINALLRIIDECKKIAKNLYLDTPNFALKEDIDRLKDIVDKTGVKIVANNYYALSICDDFIIGGGLNVYNDYSAGVFNKKVIRAEENKTADFPYMTLRHCPIKEHTGCECANCKYDNDYTLTAENKMVMKIKRKKLSTCTFYLTD